MATPNTHWLTSCASLVAQQEIIHFYWLVRQTEIASFQWFVHLLTELMAIDNEQKVRERRPEWYVCQIVGETQTVNISH